MQINNDHKLARYSLALTVLLFISAWLNTPWSLAQDISPAIKADEIKAVMQDQPEASEVSPESESPGIDLLTLVNRSLVGQGQGLAQVG